MRREGEGKQRDADMLRGSKARPQAFEELARNGNLISTPTSTARAGSISAPTAEGARRSMCPRPLGTTPATPADGAGAQPQPQQTLRPRRPRPRKRPRKARRRGRGPAGSAGPWTITQPPATAAAVRTYQVRSGDTLGAIAQRLLGT